MTIEEAKALLPPSMKYPLPDDVLDNLINVCEIPIKWGTDDEESDNKGMYCAMMAALIELKERREQDPKPTTIDNLLQYLSSKSH